jgi:hypothetical protein
MTALIFLREVVPNLSSVFFNLRSRLLSDIATRERERRKLGGGSERHYRLEGGVTET